MKFINSDYGEYIFIKRLFLLFFLINFAVWFFLTKEIRPDLTITPVPPGKHLLKALSMGDDLFIYRYFGYKVQMAGDDYGTTTPLQKYSYSKLQKWFYLLEEFDGVSEYIPSIAGFYYSNSQNDLDNIYIVDFLVHFASKNPNKYWRWLATALYLSNSKLHDYKRIQDISNTLVELDKTEVPLWARTIGIFILSKDNICKSIDLILSLDQNELEAIAKDKILGNSIKDEENMFLKIIVNRIHEIQSKPEAMKKCMKKRLKNV